MEHVLKNILYEIVDYDEDDINILVDSMIKYELSNSDIAKCLLCFNTYTMTGFWSKIFHDKIEKYLDDPQGKLPELLRAPIEKCFVECHDNKYLTSVEKNKINEIYLVEYYSTLNALETMIGENFSFMVNYKYYHKNNMISNTNIDSDFKIKNLNIPEYENIEKIKIEFPIEYKFMKYIDEYFKINT